MSFVVKVNEDVTIAAESFNICVSVLLPCIGECSCNILQLHSRAGEVLFTVFCFVY